MRISENSDGVDDHMGGGSNVRVLPFQGCPACEQFVRSPPVDASFTIITHDLGNAQESTTNGNRDRY